MATMTIRSHHTGEEFSFWMDAETGYIYLEGDELKECLGRQICAGGGFNGALLYADSEEQFKSLCSQWFRSHQKGKERYDY